MNFAIVHVRSFCCCLPLKFGVWLFTLLYFIVGTALSVLGWYLTANYDNTDLRLSRQQQVSLIINTSTWTLLAVVTLIGIATLFSRSVRFLNYYSSLLWLHWGSSIGSGAYFIYTLFREDGDGIIGACVDAGDSEDQCQDGFRVLRGVIIAVYIVIWLIELFGNVTINQYYIQRMEETSAGAGATSFAKAGPTLPPVSLPPAEPMLEGPPPPPLVGPPPPGRFSPTRTQPGGIIPPAGAPGLPPPVPFNGAAPPVQTQPYAFSTRPNSHGYADASNLA
ncbi:hypothetical protein OF83DRAFT_1169969 [Amylostereum chailletii]|nr:hypothetical protein OF83DRAFT_1169969 [Amylostereum chailletii]